MSESLSTPGPSENDNQASRLALNVEGALFDPAIQRVLEKAAGYDQFVRSVPVTSERRSAIVDELDEAWGLWTGAPVAVSGRVMMLDKKNRVSEKLTLDNAAATSYGFNIYTVDPDPNDRHEEVKLARIVHDVFISGASLGKKYANDEYYHALAPIESAVLHTNIPSPERALMWLEASSPYFLEEVDTRLNGAPQPESALLELRRLPIHETLEVHDELTRNSAETYLNSLVRTKDVLPYYMTYDGDVVPTTADGEYVSVNRRGRALALLGALSIEPHLASPRRTLWRLSVPAELHTNDASDIPEQVSMPIDSIISLSSSRNQL